MTIEIIAEFIKKSINLNTQIHIETSSKYDPLRNEWLQTDDTEDSNSTPKGTDNPPQSKRKRRGKHQLTF